MIWKPNYTLHQHKTYIYDSHKKISIFIYHETSGILLDGILLDGIRKVSF